MENPIVEIVGCRDGSTLVRTAIRFTDQWRAAEYQQEVINFISRHRGEPAFVPIGC
jgi:hypothetical protein